MLTDVTSVETKNEPKANQDDDAKAAARARRLANLRPQRPGTPSHNPRGRPKKDYDLAAMAQAYAKQAVNTLGQCLVDPEASWPAKVSAASELLDRGFGKAPADLKIKHEIGFSEQFEQFIRDLTACRDGNRAKVIDHVESHSAMSGENPA